MTDSPYDCGCRERESLAIQDWVLDLRRHDSQGKERMVMKIGILGDLDVDKASFMRRYVCDSFQNSSLGYYTLVLLMFSLILPLTEIHALLFASHRNA